MQVELGVSRIVEGQAIEVLVVGAIGQGVVAGSFGTVDGQMEELVDLHGHDAVVLTAAEHKAGAPEAAQGVLVVGCATKAQLFIIMEHAQATAVIGSQRVVRLPVVRLAVEVPRLSI